MKKNIILIALILLCGVGAIAQEVKILAYNVFLRPDPVGWWDYKQERFPELVESSRKYDIIGLAEVFDTKLLKEWKDRLHDTHPYVVNPPKKEWSLINGGIMFFSRYPIEFYDTVYYKEADNWDQFADKGAIFARFKLPSDETIEVVMTHAQAGGEYSAIRVTQFKQLIEMADKHQTKAMFIMGDMNVDDKSEEYGEMMKIFGQPNDLYPAVNKDPGYTKGGEENPLGGGKTKKRIDYIFLKDPGKQIRINNCRVNKFPMAKPVGKALFMSDHYAVETTVQVGETRSDYIIQPQITLQLSTIAATDIDGRIMVVDSDNNRQEQSFQIAQGQKQTRLSFSPTRGRIQLKIISRQRTINRIFDGNFSQIKITLPLGHSSLYYQAPADSPAQLRLSGPFFHQEKLYPGQSSRIEKLAAGDYHLSLTIGHHTLNDMITVGENQNLDLNSLLNSGNYASLSGTIPIQWMRNNAKLCLYDSKGEMTVVYLNGNQFHIPYLKKGHYRLMAIEYPRKPLSKVEFDLQENFHLNLVK